jgi:hypothetical protein
MLTEKPSTLVIELTMKWQYEGGLFISPADLRTTGIGSIHQ